MTTSGTATFELQVDQLIRRALQLAGLLEASQRPADFEADLEMARDFLSLELTALQAENLLTRNVERKTLTLSAGVASYQLDADCIDVFVGPDNVVGTILSSAGSAETLVRAIRRHEYVEIANKTSSGTPVLCFVEKLARVSVVFWPIPGSTVTFNYQKVRAVMDVTPGSATPDVWVRRQNALLWSLAFTMAVAKSQPLAKCAFLKGERDRVKEMAKQDDVESGHGQLYIAHMV